MNQSKLRRPENLSIKAPHVPDFENPRSWSVAAKEINRLGNLVMNVFRVVREALPN
jgi:hypothetical protein